MYLSALAFAAPVTINMQPGVRASPGNGIFERRDIDLFRGEEPIGGENVLHCRMSGAFFLFIFFFLLGFESVSRVRKCARWNIPQVCWKAFHTAILGKAHGRHLEKEGEACWNMDGAPVTRIQRAKI